MSRGRVLVTGFEPFGGDDRNPTEEIARILDGETVGGAEIRGITVPVSVRRAWGVVEEALREWRPDVAISLGLAPFHSNIAVERVAINLLDARIPDNDGYRPVDEPIVEGAPAAYFSTLPTREMVEELRRRGIPAVLSYSAGTYLCNYVMFRLLHFAAVNGYPERAGFIHVPYTPDQVTGKFFLPGRAAPSMCLDTEVEAVRTAVAVSLAPRERERQMETEGGAKAEKAE
ncbi:MAG: pyroglutamyl-peptidase I [Thermococci archaeon]|nr:pyroglutamyl-peptidase I [Thermococci archaeon]